MCLITTTKVIFFSLPAHHDTHTHKFSKNVNETKGLIKKKKNTTVGSEETVTRTTTHGGCAEGAIPLCG